MKRGFLELSKSRRNVFEFSDKPVKAAHLKKILEAGRWAPSFLNSQPWHFFVIKDKPLISRIIPTAAYRAFYSDPPILIMVALDNAACSPHSGIKFGQHEHHPCIEAVGMAVLSMALEAFDLEISSCIITPVKNALKKLVKIPERYTILEILGVGYEKKGGYKTVKERRPLSQTVTYYGK